MARPIRDIAIEIQGSWRKVNYAAQPYLDAMKSLVNINDMYGYDTGKSIVLYFLSNSGTWRGDDARRIKKELRALCK